MTRLKDKHPPQRTCIACRHVKEKENLIRLVRTENGVIEIDLLSKKPGRGAYLCLNKACWELALKKDRLEYALRIKLNEGNRQALIDYSHNLSEGK